MQVSIYHFTFSSPRLKRENVNLLRLHLTGIILKGIVSGHWRSSINNTQYYWFYIAITVT